MRSLHLLVVSIALVLAVACQVTVAQYDEECHFECITIYCDLFDDYCDYDCHEVCYPYRKLGANVEQDFVKTGRSGDSNGRIGLHSLVHNHRFGHSHDRESSRGAHTDKVIRMRIQKPAQDKRVRTQPANVRSNATPARFALFDSCLSDSRASTTRKN